MAGLILSQFLVLLKSAKHFRKGLVDAIKKLKCSETKVSPGFDLENQGFRHEKIEHQ